MSSRMRVRRSVTQLRPQHRPLCRRGAALLLLFALASLSDSTEVLLESTPSSVISSMLSSTDAGGVGPVTSPLGSTSVLSGGLAGAAVSALGSAVVLSASAVNKKQPGAPQHVNLTTCHLKTLQLGHFNLIINGCQDSSAPFELLSVYFNPHVMTIFALMPKEVLTLCESQRRDFFG